MIRKLRDMIRRFLTEYEEKYPGSLYAALRSFEKIKLETNGKSNKCKYCGDPSNGEICRACQLIISLKLAIPKDEGT